MTKELVCIVCPRSCRMTITSEGDELVVTGNTCKRGKEFAINEMTDPRRTVCTTVRTSFLRYLFYLFVCRELYRRIKSLI